MTQHLHAQYGTPQRLQARIDTHRRYSVGPPLEDAVDTALSLTGSEAVLDIGCGPGDFLGRLAQQGHRGALCGVDLSPGMVEQAARTYPAAAFRVGDAQALPFPYHCADVVTARHMLYHVPDVRAALREVRRVLRPGGRFLAVTNAAGYMQEWWDAYERALSVDTGSLHTGPLHTGSLATRHPDSLKFTEADGTPLVQEVFGNVRTTFTDSALLFPTAQAALPYFRSLFDTPPPAGAEELFLAEVQRRMGPGGWRVGKRVALLGAVKV